MAADPGDCLAYKNFAIAARDDFRLQESYDAIMKATGLHPNYRGSPFQLLCDSCLDQCRPVEAWDALKKYQIHRRLRDAYTLQFDQNELDATAARMFLALGRPETAVRFARRRVERPQRLAYSAAEGRDETFSAELALLEALRDRLEQLREQSAEGATAGQADAADSTALHFECWALEKRLLRTLGDEQFLLRRLRPPRPDNVLHLLPGGVAAEALRRARQKEEHPSAEPYFDAMEADLAWHRSRYAQALALARKALDKLPADFEKHLRARLAVVAGESARKLGKTDEMWPLFDQALRDCPAVFRMYRVAIPVGLSDDGTPLARALGRRILASPRFRNDPAGFPVILRTAGGQLTFELSRLGQARHCADSVGTEGAAAEVVATACHRLHQRLMSPLLDLKPIDVNFLEGSLFAAPPGEQIDRTIGLIKAR
jgi:tetratricopeptide (TPR) repeat protein